MRFFRFFRIWRRRPVFGLFAGADMRLIVEAHGYLAASFPPAKAHLKTSPHKIKLHFSLRADARYSTIRSWRSEKGRMGTFHDAAERRRAICI